MPPAMRTRPSWSSVAVWRPRGLSIAAAGWNPGAVPVGETGRGETVGGAEVDPDLPAPPPVQPHGRSTVTMLEETSRCVLMGVPSPVVPEIADPVPQVEL